MMIINHIMILSSLLSFEFNRFIYTYQNNNIHNNDDYKSIEMHPLYDIK